MPLNQLRHQHHKRAWVELRNFSSNPTDGSASQIWGSRLSWLCSIFVRNEYDFCSFFSILSLNSSFSKFKKNSRFFFLKFTQKISCSYLNHVFLSFIFQSQYMRTFPKNRDHPRRHRGNHDKWIFKLVVNSHRIQSNLRPVSVWRGMHHKKKSERKTRSEI